MGSGRSQRSICLSTFDTRNEHVRETPKARNPIFEFGLRPTMRWEKPFLPFRSQKTIIMMIIFSLVLFNFNFNFRAVKTQGPLLL